MPPKPKFSKQDILDAALKLVRDEGIEHLTARSLAQKLGCSVCPVFTVFENMEELQAEVIRAAKDLYSQYVEEGLKFSPAFKGVGMQYINIAVNEPRLFRMLFMAEQPERPSVTDILPAIEDNYDKILQSVCDCYDFNLTQAVRLYRHLWIYTHGIASLCATNTCNFTSDEISTMLTEVCRAQVVAIKGETK